MENLDRPVTSKVHEPVTSKLPTRKAQRTSLENRAKRLKKNEQFFTSFHKTEKEETLPNSESSIALILQPILQPKASKKTTGWPPLQTQKPESPTRLVKQSHDMQRPHTGIRGRFLGTQGWPTQQLTEHTLSTGKRSTQSSQEKRKKHRVCAEHLLSFWASRRWVCARQRHGAQPRDRPAPSLQGASCGRHSTQAVTHRWGGDSACPVRLRKPVHLFPSLILLCTLSLYEVRAVILRQVWDPTESPNLEVVLGPFDGVAVTAGFPCTQTHRLVARALL